MDVHGVLHGISAHSLDHIAAGIPDGHGTTVAAGNPPELHGGRCIGGELDRILHGVKGGAAAEVDALAGLVTVIKGLGTAVNLGLGTVNDGEIAIGAGLLDVAVGLFAGCHGSQIRGGIQYVDPILCRGRDRHGGHQSQHHDEGQNSGNEPFAVVSSHIVFSSHIFWHCANCAFCTITIGKYYHKRGNFVKFLSVSSISTS